MSFTSETVLAKDSLVCLAHIPKQRLSTLFKSDQGKSHGTALAQQANKESWRTNYGQGKHNGQIRIVLESKICWKIGAKLDTEQHDKVYRQALHFDKQS